MGSNEVDTHEVSDRSLMRRLRLGSEDAATQIYLRYAHRLQSLAQANSSANLARHVDAEEIVQSVFGSFFRGVRAGHYEVPEGEELWRLFLVMGLNKIRAKGAYYGAAKRDIRQTVGGEAIEFEADDASALNFLNVTIQETLETLSEPQRQMVMLRIEGFTVEEMASRTGRSKRTVERLLQAAREKLAHLVQED